jgi:hypothetical protein
VGEFEELCTRYCLFFLFPFYNFELHFIIWFHFSKFVRCWNLVRREYSIGVFTLIRSCRSGT